MSNYRPRGRYQSDSFERRSNYENRDPRQQSRDSRGGHSSGENFGCDYSRGENSRGGYSRVENSRDNYSRGNYSRNDRSRSNYSGGDRSRNDYSRGYTNGNDYSRNYRGHSAPQQDYDYYLTNFVKIEVSDKPVNKYSVSFSPIIESTGIRYKLINQHNALFGTTKSFDGTLLYLTRRLPSDDTILTSTLEREGVEIQVRVRFLESVNMKSCHSLVSVILKRILRYLNLQRIGHNYFSPHLNINIDNSSLSLWPGFSTSLREYEDGLLWNIDTSFKLLRNECVLDLMGQMYFSSNNLHVDCARTLIGCVVITRYNNKTYRIDDIAWDRSPKDTFEWKNGEQISFVDYYKQIYQLDITDTDQPLLINLPKASKNTGTGNPQQKKSDLTLICLIPEFCYLTGISDEMRNNFKLMKEISRHISGPATNKVKAICSLVEMVHSNKEANSELQNWGLNLSTSLHKVQSNKMEIEPIYGRDPDQALRAEAPGSWNGVMRNIYPISTPSLSDWICIHTRRDAQTVERFMQALQQAVTSCKLSFSPPRMIAIDNDSTESYLNVIAKESSQNPNLSLIMSVFPTQREDRYASFKKLLCCQQPIPSQALCTRTIGDPKKMNTVANRVALQINCKLGGELWRVHIPIRNVLVIGIDVNHCGVSKARNSVVGFVSSLNDTLTKWYSRVAFQAQSHEIVHSLRLFVSQALAKYYEVNHTLPSRIIVYRDGVGMGQVEASKTLEVEHIQQALAEFADDYAPQLLYILVRKRIRTRYFCENSDGSIVNPPSGSVIDTSIISNECPNFFLISQNYTQGCILPINLAIVHNSSNLTMEQIQKFTYKCTYLYYNWSGTVRVPAPCLYAHKVAFMSGQYLNAEASPELADKLYYI